jgi:hypothetical protein
MARRLGLLLIAVVAATVLSGCSPAPSKQLAIRVVNGETEFVFAPCPNERVHDVILKEENETDFDLWHASGGDAAPVMSSMRLFHTPDGWITGNGSLSALERGKSYEGSIYSGSARRSDLRSITLDAIEGLGDDQVLGPGETASRATAMSMADFQRNAASDC